MVVVVSIGVFPNGLAGRGGAIGWTHTILLVWGVRGVAGPLRPCAGHCGRCGLGWPDAMMGVTTTTPTTIMTAAGLP